MSPFIRSVALRAGDRLTARGVLAIVAALYVATFTGLPDHGDAEVEYQTASSLVREGTTALGGTPESEMIVERRFNVRINDAGEAHGWSGIAQAVVAVPLVAAGRLLARVWPEIEAKNAQSTHYGAHRSEYFSHLLVGLRNPLLGALTAWLLTLTVLRLDGGRKSALIAGLSYGLASFAWPQARSTLSDVQATFFLFASFHLLVKIRERYESWSRPRRLELALVGASLAGALLTRLAVAPAVLVMACVTLAVCLRGRRWLFRGRGPRVSAAFVDTAIALAPLALGGLFLLYANWRRFGSPFDPGYTGGFQSSVFGAYPAWLAIGGILFAPGKGLLWLAPGLLLLPLGLRRARSLGERLWPWCTGLVFLAVLLPLATSVLWMGGWTYGPRYLLPVLPFLWVGVGLGLDRIGPRLGLRRLAMAAVLFGLVTNVPAVLVDHMTHQDLALQSANAEWPAPDEGIADWQDGLLIKVHWEWDYAAPWAHWRILRHRLAGLGEEFSAQRIFGNPDPTLLLTPAHERERGFRHLAWVDLHQRLGGSVWPVALLVLALVGLGLVSSVRGLDPTSR